MHGLLPLHVAAHNADPDASDLVDLLLCIHVEGAKVESKDGLLPIHYASQNTGSVKKVFVDALLSAYPLSTVKEDLVPSDPNAAIDYSKSKMQRETLASLHRQVLLDT